MHTNLKAVPAGASARQELKNLELLETGTQIQEALAKIANAFGKIQSISQLALSNEYWRPEYVFFIHFANTNDAMNAARDLGGLLYGFSALVVTVPRNGFGRVS